MVTKEEFFTQHCQDKSILTFMTVSGSAGGQIYLFNQTKDAILMGGTLIMLPDEELHDQMNKGKFEGEVADAYGEVANIIAGGLTQTFLERYPQQLRFVKTSSVTVIPTKIDMAGDEPMPAGQYYVASCAISLQGSALGRMLLLFPAAVLRLENYNQPEPGPEKSREPAPPSAGPQASASGAVPSATPAQRQMPSPPADATPLVLIITDSPQDAEVICASLTHSSYETRVIGYKDDLRAIFNAHPVLGIFLLMSEVGEKGFSVAIKLQSSGYPLPPVIAGGPAWTRSSVLKAVKYGVRDILVTPASDEEIREKFSQHLSLPA
jgi:CheY-like chemotaxis protein